MNTITITGKVNEVCPENFRHQGLWFTINAPRIHNLTVVKPGTTPPLEVERGQIVTVTGRMQVDERVDGYSVEDLVRLMATSIEVAS